MPHSSDKHLHIIAFDVPWPANYGGVIDIYHKIRSLHELGVKVHLHCFEYGRAHAPELNEICFSVSYYKRRLSKRLLFSELPFVVIGRQSDELIENLLVDEHPILFEGTHSCFYLADDRLKGRLKIMRAHNVEQDYYSGLARVESNPFRKRYFKQEAKKLELFEDQLEAADHILAISPNDHKHFSKRFSNVHYLSAFHSNDDVTSEVGSGDFAFYHGSLGIGENNEAALFLIEKVFNDIDVPLKIAGSDASKELKEAVAQYVNVELLEGISTEEIMALMKAAHLNVLPTFQATGIKLKLLFALYNGRHCLCNSGMALNTGLEELVTIADEPVDLKKEVKRLMELPFDAAEIENRKEVLERDMSNNGNAQRIVELL